MARDKELSTDDKFELLLNVLAQKQDSGLTPELLKDLLAGQATAMQKAMKPENAQHPNVSAFRPHGGADPVLPFEFYFFGFPFHKSIETLHDTELTLAAQVQPGTFTILKKDFTPLQVEVRAERDAQDTITKLQVGAPEGKTIAREDFRQIPPLATFLYMLVHPGDRHQRYMEGYQVYLNMTLGQKLAVTA